MHWQLCCPICFPDYIALLSRLYIGYQIAAKDLYKVEQQSCIIGITSCCVLLAGVPFRCFAKISMPRP